MDAVDVARWQFAITTVYHFLFVPITIGLSLVVAIFHAVGADPQPEYLRLTKFFGLFIINFALGLVTGIVQEFQFGMNWSDYSRFVGDIFGAPSPSRRSSRSSWSRPSSASGSSGGAASPRSCTCRDDVAGPHRHRAVGVLHPRRQLLHAEPRRLPVQPGHRPR